MKSPKWRKEKSKPKILAPIGADPDLFALGSIVKVEKDTQKKGVSGE